MRTTPSPSAAPPGAAPPRFLADVMLERLARWLRVLDADVVSAGTDEPDAALAERARDEGRLLLTRDRRLAGDAGPLALRVPAATPLEQLRHVLARVPLPLPPALFARCLLCNVPLVPEPAEAPAPAAAPTGAAAPPRRRCPGCERLYWEGQHTRRMRAALGAVLGDRLPPSP